MTKYTTRRDGLGGRLGWTARALSAVALGAALGSPLWSAQPPGQPEAEPPLASVATVAVRLILSTDGQPAVARTSAGFFVTPEGHVLTTYQAVGGEVTSNYAVVANPLGPLPGAVDVVWTMPGSEAPQAFQAWVLAANPEYDVAVLSVIGAGRAPHLPIGDSENLILNQPVAAFGAPGMSAATLAPARVGRIREAPPKAPPTEGGAPWLACDAVAWPEAVGGPVIDAEGFVVAVAQAAPQEGQRKGTAVPIHLALPVLEIAGVAQELPTRLALGDRETFEGKGLRMQVAGDLQDTAPERTRWMSGPNTLGLTFRIDRFVSQLGTGGVERSLLAGALGDGSWQPYDAQIPTATGMRPVPAGRARHYGSARAFVGDVPSAMEYAILSLGQEKVVARYVGPIDLMSFNRGVLRRSLESIRPSALLRNPMAAPVEGTFEPAELGVESAPKVRAPTGWRREPLTALLPSGLPPPDASASWSPENDFTVSFRCLWWRTAPATPTKAAAAVMARRGASRDVSYGYAETFLGTNWVAAGSFAAAGDGLLLREVRAPRETVGFLDDLFKEWTSQ